MVCSLVVGDSLNNEVSPPDVENQLSKKLGLKVVLQMENSDGEVVFQDVVNQSNASSTPVESNPGMLASLTLYCLIINNKDV